MKNFLFGTIAFLVSAIITLLILEGAVRLLVDKSRWQYKDSTTDYQRDDTLGWRQKSNFSDKSFNSDNTSVLFETNKDGLRPKTAVPKRRNDSVKRVLLIGNSVVAARNVPEDQTIHYYLDSILSAKYPGKDIEVINAGVQGYSTDQVYMMLQRLGPLYRPDAVLYAFCENDLGGNGTAKAYGLHKPYFTLAPNGTLGFSPLKEYNTVINDFQTSWTKAILVKSALYRFCRPYFVGFMARFKSDKEKVLESGLAADYFLRPETVEKLDFSLFSALISGMKTYCDRDSAAFYLYSHPTIESVWVPQQEVLKKQHKTNAYYPAAFENKIAEVCSKAKVNFIPFVDYFLRRQDQGPFHLLPSDPHCNGRGYKLQAECIANRISL